MPGFETLFVVLVAAVLAVGALALFASLRAGAASDAMAELANGRFAEALARARTGARAPRDELYAAAVAAKHLQLWDRAEELLSRILASDPGDGEAWLERGLTAAYAGRAPAAAAALSRALAGRSDLAESITLHRAWLALAQGDRAAARRLFDEVEAPLESKLRSDLGEGDPLFAEWFLQAAALWDAAGDAERAAWAAAAGRAAAPESRLPDLILSPAASPSVPPRPPLQ
jgi:tetratricopeptide (TPR) repeat protein